MPPRFASAYLSARHMRRAELQAVVAELAAGGVAVTSRWLAGEWPRPESRLDPNWLALASKEDIELAEVFVLTGDERGDSGHRHVEFGIALALGKPIVVVAAEPENLWQRLPGATVVATWQQAVAHLVAPPPALP